VVETLPAGGPPRFAARIYIKRIGLAHNAGGYRGSRILRLSDDQDTATLDAFSVEVGLFLRHTQVYQAAYQAAGYSTHPGANPGPEGS
jgi:hypothetical protein